LFFKRVTFAPLSTTSPAAVSITSDIMVEFVKSMFEDVNFCEIAFLIFFCIIERDILEFSERIVLIPSISTSTSRILEEVVVELVSSISVSYGLLLISVIPKADS